MKITLPISLSAVILSPAFAQSAIVISEIDFNNNVVEIANTGTTSVDLSNYWFCNFPSYTQASNSAFSIADSSTATSLTLGAGDVLVLNITDNFAANNGEFGLYSTNALGFGNSTAIVDYLSWGADSTRDSVAAAAGIWDSGTFIDTSSLTAGQTIQLNENSVGNGIGDSSIGSANFGVVPEPSTGLLALLGSLSLISRRKRS